MGDLGEMMRRRKDFTIPSFDYYYHYILVIILYSSYRMLMKYFSNFAICFLVVIKQDFRNPQLCILDVVSVTMVKGDSRFVNSSFLLLISNLFLIKK